MPWGNGRFTRTQNWKNDAAAGIKITTVNHDDEDDNFKNGIDNCLHKGGGNTATANLNMAGFKITHAGSATADDDVMTLSGVNNMAGWSQSKALTGTDLSGRLNFAGATGNNGLTFTSADMSFLSKPAKASQTSNRLVVNDSLANPTDAGTDVFIIDERGWANFKRWSQNLSYSTNDSKDRTIAPGKGSYLEQNGGTLSFAGNKTATTVDNYVVTTLTTAMTLTTTGIMTLNGDHVAQLSLNKGGKTNADASRLAGYTQGSLRWVMDLGNAIAETGSNNTGSNFSIYAYSDAGALLEQAMDINRNTRAVNFYGDVKVNAGTIYADSTISSTDTTCILSTTGAGTVYLRPNGAGSGAGQAYQTSDGNFHSTGGIMLASDQAGFYAGGSGRVMQFAPNWYWDWNSTNGNLTWYANAAAHFGAIFYATGDFTMYGNVAAKLNAGQFISYSDARLKTIGSEYTTGLAAILQIVPRWFSRTDVEHEGQFVGLIGQEIEPVMPETCTRQPGPDGLGGTIDDLIMFDPTNIQYALVNAVKELSQKLEDALARIVTLEAKA